MNDLFSIAAMGILGLTVIGYMSRHSAQEARELSVLMKQQTDKIISEGNKRLEISLTEANRRHEANMSESRKWMRELSIITAQIFDRKNLWLRQHQTSSGLFAPQEGEERVDKPKDDKQA